MKFRPVFVLSLMIAVAALIASPLIGSAGAQASWKPQCADPYHGGARSKTNPLMISPAPPASDPLAGANLFVAGPAHGLAAGAIARLIGIDSGVPLGQPLPSVSESESWATFWARVQAKLPSLSASVQHQVQLLAKIAQEPEPQRISRFSQGGTPIGIYSQAQKVYCHIGAADPQGIPIISTYFLHSTLGGCPTNGQDNAYRPTFESQINALAKATGNRPVIFLLEIDFIGSSGCISKAGQLAGWEGLMRYEAKTLGALPHSEVYIEGGYADANSPSYAARVLKAAGVRGVEGFFVNDTHNDWTSNEVKYSEKISKLIGHKHFIVNTATNGRGPLLNPHPVRQGVENLCNPPGRGLGPQPTTATGFPGADAFLWTFPPGNSSGSCNGGPPSGSWWEARAESLATNANGKLGPGHPSKPY